MWNNRVHYGSLGGPRARNNNNGKLHHVGSYRKEKEKKKQGDFPVGFPRKVLSLVGHHLIHVGWKCYKCWSYEHGRGSWTQQHSRKFFIHALKSVRNCTKLVDYLKENRKQNKKRGQQLTRFMRDLRSREVLTIHYRTLYFTLLL